MNLRRGTFTRSLATALAVGVAGSDLRAVNAQGLPAVTLATLVNDTATAALYAVHGGVFRKAGLNVQLQVLTSGAAGAAAVAGGSAQFGLSSLVTLFSAHERGLPFTLIAPAGVITPDVAYSQFVVRKDAPFKSARDLNGKTIGSPALKDFDTVAIMNWVDANGGDSKTLRFIEIPGSVAIAALEDGRIDGAELNTPNLTRALEGGKLRALAQIFDAIAPRFANTGWFTTTDYATKNRDVVERFARAMTEANAYCNAHHAETVPLVAENAKLDERLVARMARVTFADYLRPREIQPLIDVAYKYHTIGKTFDARELISPYAAKPPGG